MDYYTDKFTSQEKFQKKLALDSRCSSTVIKFSLLYEKENTAVRVPDSLGLMSTALPSYCQSMNKVSG